MTKCLMKPQEVVSQPMLLVLPNPTTVKKSTTFVQKLIAVSISNITYLRGIFPEQDYVDRELEGLHLKILTEKKGVASAGARELINWVRGALEAFEKRYLRQLILYMYPNEEQPNVALETYTFSFMYKDEEVIISSGSMHHASGTSMIQQKEAHVDIENLRQAVVKLLRNNLILTQGMKPLPPDVLLAMKLLYYDEVTPEDYEPPCFQRSEDPVIDFISKPLQIKNGKVSTPFHVVKLHTKAIKSCFQGCETDSDKEEDMQTDKQSIASMMDMQDTNKEVAPTLNRTEPEMELMDCIPTSQPPCSNIPRVGTSAVPHSVPADTNCVAHADIPLISPAQPASGVLMVGSAFDDDRSSCTEFRNAAVYCPCGVQRETGLQLLCQTCLRWNHAPCYRFLKQSECPIHFFCIECHDESDPEKYCNDATLINMPVDERREVCLYRHVLSICMDAWRINADLIVQELQIPAAKAEELMVRMDEDGVFKPKKGKDAFRVVNKRCLNMEVKERYFNMDGDIVRQAKTTMSVEETPQKTLANKRNYDSNENECSAKDTSSKRQKVSHSSKSFCVTKDVTPLNRNKATRAKRLCNSK